MFAAPIHVVGEGQNYHYGMPSQRQWNVVLRLFGAMIAMTGVAVSIAVMVMSNRNEKNNRFPWEGVLLFSVGLIMVLFSLYYTDPEVERRRRESCQDGDSSDVVDIDQPPPYWEVCNSLSAVPQTIEPTSVTSGNGEIVVTITRVKSTADDRTVAMDTPYQPSDEEPDEPLPKYEDVVQENERICRTSSV